MVDLKITFVSADGAIRQLVNCSFAEEEWKTVEEFHAEVEQLRSTRFVQERGGGTISLKYRADGGIASQAGQVDVEKVHALLHKLRPFVLKGEKFYFHSMRGLFGRRLDHQMFRTHLRIIKDHFELRRVEALRHLSRHGAPPMSVDRVMDWLNAFEYHRDHKKRQFVEAELGIFGNDQNGLPVVLFVIVEMVQAILQLGDFAETLIQESNGSLEFKCPNDWFE